jgi:molecular chaperone DnaK (HSP70)
MEGETITLIKDPSSLGFSVPSSIFVTPQEQVLVGHLYEQLNRILLVGGSCRIPHVQQRLKQEFKHPISMAPDLELVVCQGTALYADQHPVSIVSPDANNGAYTTIGAAIEAAQPKSQIVVRSGTYRESIMIDREIEIIGSGSPETIIIEATEAIGIQVATPTARICGLTIRHTPSTPFLSGDS